MIKRIWRFIRNKCRLCGKTKANKHNEITCIHCTWPSLCHNCGKGINFWQLYGSSRETLLKELKD